MAIQRLRIEQVRGTTNTYNSFGDQLLSLGDAYIEEHIPTNGQTQFILQREYTLGYRNLKVSVNGIMQPVEQGVYIETSPTIVTFVEQLYDTDIVQFRIEGAGSGTTFTSDHKHMVRETPTGTQNGVNKLFALSKMPISGEEMIYVNGLMMHPGDDYTIAGQGITFTNAPSSGDKIRVNYQVALRTISSSES